MNAAFTKNSFFERFRGQLPEILYTNVPLPSFMETPISDLIFKDRRPVSRQRNKPRAKSSSPTCLEGKIAHGKNTKYSMDEKDLEIDNGTWIIGNIDFGMNARAKGRMQGEKFYVSQLVVLNKKN